MAEDAQEGTQAGKHGHAVSSVAQMLSSCVEFLPMRPPWCSFDVANLKRTRLLVTFASPTT